MIDGEDAGPAVGALGHLGERLPGGVLGRGRARERGGEGEDKGRDAGQVHDGLRTTGLRPDKGIRRRAEKAKSGPSRVRR